jgi:DNA-binding NarL/FixJ family response regulator
VRVVIVEDQVLLREGLARLFADSGHEVVASLPDASGVLEAAGDAELVVLDIRMPPTFTDEGARAAAEIKRAHPSVGVIVLSQHIETTHAVKLVPLGGFGYLLKDRVLAVGEFLEAAERVARGGSALDPQVVGRLLGRDRTLSELSDREREVLQMMAEGLTNSGIAKRLFLSERTVEAHVRHVLSKLDIPKAKTATGACSPYSRIYTRALIKAPSPHATTDYAPARRAPGRRAGPRRPPGRLPCQLGASRPYRAGVTPRRPPASNRAKVRRPRSTGRRICLQATVLDRSQPTSCAAASRASG